VLAHPGGTITLIDESYNANPASMRAALEMLAGVAPESEGRRIAVLGDMLELGTHAQKLHAGLSEAVEDAGVDLALLAGPEMLALKGKLEGKIAVEHFESAAALGDRLSSDVRAGDVIMVKSSNGMGFSKVVDGLLQAYPAAKADGPAAAAE
jgi:UDP-N-acetylmuramoyl-tripeptide--D-alanyl-D-alanine ligase